MKQMVARCTLDYFVRNNKYSVKVSPYSLPVEFPEFDYKVPPGALFDFTVLYGKGFQLEAKNVTDDADMSKEVGGASILDGKGKPTGYRISLHGSCDAQGQWDYEYMIEDENFRGIESRDYEKRFRRGQEILKRERAIQSPPP